MAQPHEVELLEGTAELLPYFKSINEEWIQEMFVIEKTDVEILENAKQRVLDRGGRIVFARDRELGVVGTCALLKRGEGRFELTKMGVLRAARGRGIGERLLEHVISLARGMSVETLFLLTNAKCDVAIRLYEKHGFRHDARIMEEYGAFYRRCNVAMRHRKGAARPRR